MGTLDRLAKLKYVGWPRFDAGRRYLGPLPPHCGHVHTKKLIGWDAELGSFRTAPSAAYPPLMCEWLAEAIILHVSSFNVQNSVKQPPTGEEEGQGNLTDKKDLTMENLTMQNHTTQVACSSDALDIASSSDALDNMSTVKGDTPPSAGHPTQIASSSNTLPEKRKRGSNRQKEGTPQAPKIVIEDTSDEDEDGHWRPLLRHHLGGSGLPVQARFGDKGRFMHDGAGLCSPGRYLPHQRRNYVWAGIRELQLSLRQLILQELPKYNTLIFHMATGKIVHSPFSEELLGKARDMWSGCIRKAQEGKDLSISLEEVSPGQPFYLEAIGETLRLMQDPDFRIYSRSSHSFRTGVPVGYNIRMPRTPAVFERKVHWRKYEEMSFNPLNTNYKSVAGHEEALREQFIEEAKLGMMVEMSLEEAQKLYPGSLLRLSALGANEKPDATFRVLTDATHGVQINNEVRPRDQMKMPGAADARATMCASAHLAGVHFSIQADISKAHRRFKHRQQDWGLLGCQLTPGRVWLNKVGTFRVGSASYWFSRLAAGIARISIALAGRSWTWQLVYADDI